MRGLGLDEPSNEKSCRQVAVKGQLQVASLGALLFEEANITFPLIYWTIFS